MPKSKQSTNSISVPIPLQERKQQFVRDAIWDAAIDLFDQKGFDETTVDEIAKAAGTSRRSFFRYFQSKSDLLAQAVVSYGTLLTDAIESCPAGYTLSEVFRSTVLQVSQHSAAQPRTRKVMEIAERYPAAREAQIARAAEVQDRIAEAYARHCKKSNEGALQAQVLAALTISMLSVAFHAWFRRGSQQMSITAEQVFATLAEIAADVDSDTSDRAGKRQVKKR